MPSMLLIVIFVLSLITSLVLTRFTGKIALQLPNGWFCRSSKHHCHVSKTPRTGGIAIYLTLVITFGLLSVASDLWDYTLGVNLHSVAQIALPATMIFALGLIDDITPLNAYFKLLVQVAAAVELYAFGFQVGTLPTIFGGQEVGGFFSLLLTVLWVVLVTNSFNLIDGIDGLAAGAALFAACTVFVMSKFDQNPSIVVVTIAVAAATLGFLRYNFNPARVFLGDSGSLLLGFLLSALALASAQKSPAMIGVGFSVLCFGLPLMESSLSVVRRLLNGRSVFAPDREHIHHKLLDHGLPPGLAAIVLYLVCAVFAGLSLLVWSSESGLGLLLALLAALSVSWTGLRLLGYAELIELKVMVARVFGQKKIIMNDLAIRRAAHSLRSVTDVKQLEQVLMNVFSHNGFDGYELAIAHYRARTVPGLDRMQWRNRSASNDRGLKIEIPLINAHNRDCGVLRLSGRIDRFLLVDVSVLYQDFRVALAGAIVRIALLSRETMKDAAVPATTAHLLKMPHKAGGLSISHEQVQAAQGD